jgi:sortase A
VSALEAVDEYRTVLDIRGASGDDVTVETELPARPTVRRASLRSTVVAISAAAVTALAVWFVVYAFVLSGLEERGAQARLYDRFRLELAGATAPLGGTIKAGSPVALLSAPASGLADVVVVEGTTARQLMSGPGLMADTPLPGQSGTSVIMGRSVTFGGPFSGISRMKPGDKLTVTTGQGVFTFSVLDVRRSGDQLPQPLAAGKAGITLISSVGAGWRNGLAPSGIVYVDASMQKGSAQPAPSGRPTTVSTPSLAMRGDPGALVPLIFWIEGLLVVGALTVWSWVRWGRKQTWVIATPVALLILWGASGALIRFLPNLV